MKSCLDKYSIMDRRIPAIIVTDLTEFIYFVPIVPAVLRETGTTGGPAERIGSGARRDRRHVVAQPSNNDTHHVLSPKIYNPTPPSENLIRMYLE